MSFSKDVKLLLVFSSLYKVSVLFLGTFFVSFIMSNSLDEIVSVATYEMFLYLSLIAGFFMVSAITCNSVWSENIVAN